MTIKKYLILVCIILIKFQVPVWAMPHKQEVINFVNAQFPAQKAKGFKRDDLNSFISNVTNALNTNFAHLYGPDEAPYQLEAYLDAFGLAFYTDELRQTLCGVVNVNRFLACLRKNVDQTTRSADVTRSLADVFGLVNYVEKGGNLKVRSNKASIFYGNWPTYFSTVNPLENLGYLGGSFFRALNLTVYYRDITPDLQDFPALVLYGALMPNMEQETILLHGVPVSLNALGPINLEAPDGRPVQTNNALTLLNASRNPLQSQHILPRSHPPFVIDAKMTGCPTGSSRSKIFSPDYYEILEKLKFYKDVNKDKVNGGKIMYDFFDLQSGEIFDPADPPY